MTAATFGGDGCRSVAEPIAGGRHLTGMRIVRATLTLLLLAVVVVVVPASPASACSCAYPQEGADDLFYDRADVVFSGVLVERREPGFSLTRSSADPATFVFEVDTVFKGRASARQGLLSAMSGASCGLELPEGRPVLVFAERDADGLEAGLCGGSRVLEAGDSVPYDGGGPPLAGASYPSGTSTPAYLVGAGALFAVVGAVVIWSRRGRRS